MNNCINYFDNFEVNQNQKKIIIIGEMLELGEKSMQFHKDVVFKIKKTIF